MNEFLGEDQPLRLKEACDTILKGSLTVSALRREAKRGNLDIVRVAGKDFVTPAAIREMLERCRVPRSDPGSNSKSSEAAPSTTSSETATDELRQASLQRMLVELSGPKPPRTPTAH